MSFIESRICLYTQNWSSLYVFLHPDISSVETAINLSTYQLINQSMFDLAPIISGCTFEAGSYIGLTMSPKLRSVRSHSGGAT